MIDVDAAQLIAHLSRNDRPRADNNVEAGEFVVTCVRLFEYLAEHPAIEAERSDDAVFHASFDLGVVLRTYRLHLGVSKRLLQAVERLFTGYFPDQRDGLSCTQFWDNLLGYIAWEEAPKAARAFADGSLAVLGRLLQQPHVHIRRSAIHGLNHHPDTRSAAKLLTAHLDSEPDLELRAYCQDVLAAFQLGQRLV